MVNDLPNDQDNHLSAKREVDLEGLVLGLRFTVACFNISLNSHLHAPKNLIYRAAAVQHYESGLHQLSELLNSPAVVHADEYAEIAQDTLRLFREACQRKEVGDLVSWERDFRNTFQQAAEYHFARDRVSREGKPCQKYEELLSPYARIPEFEERRALPVSPSHSPVRYETTFLYTGTQIPDRRSNPQELVLDRRCVGEMYLAMLEHVQGLSRDDARRRISPGALEGFTRSLTEKLGTYRGSVRFSILRDEGQKPKIMVKLLDLPSVP